MVDALPRLIDEGPAAGVHFVITADRRASVRGAVFGLINTVVVLRQSGVDEFGNLNLPADAIGVQAPPGRCHIDGLEGQIALLGSPEGNGQATALAELASYLPSAQQAAPVPLIPIEVHRTDLRPLQGRVVLGLDGVTLETVTLDLLCEHLCVLGRRRSGRTTALGALAAGLGGQRTKARATKPELLLVSAKPTALRSVAPWKKVIEHPADALALAEELGALDPSAAGPPIVVFIDDLTDLGESFDAAMDEVLASGSTCVRVVVAAETRKAMTSYGGSVLGELRQAPRGLVLQPSLPEHEDLFGVRLTASSKLRFPPGRGSLATVIRRRSCRSSSDDSLRPTAGRPTGRAPRIISTGSANAAVIPPALRGRPERRPTVSTDYGDGRASGNDRGRTRQISRRWTSDAVTSPSGAGSQGRARPSWPCVARSARWPSPDVACFAWAGRRDCLWSSP